MTAPIDQMDKTQLLDVVQAKARCFHSRGKAMTGELYRRSELRCFTDANFRELARAMVGLHVSLVGGEGEVRRAWVEGASLWVEIVVAQ